METSCIFRSFLLKEKIQQWLFSVIIKTQAIERETKKWIPLYCIFSYTFLLYKKGKKQVYYIHNKCKKLHGILSKCFFS